jgi:hypothetical protein
MRIAKFCLLALLCAAAAFGVEVKIEMRDGKPFVVATNNSDKEATVKYRVTYVDSDGKTVTKFDTTLTLPPRTHRAEQCYANSHAANPNWQVIKDWER